MLETAKEKQHITYRGTAVPMPADFSSETRENRKSSTMFFKY